MGLPVLGLRSPIYWVDLGSIVIIKQPSILTYIYNIIIYITYIPIWSLKPVQNHELIINQASFLTYKLISPLISPQYPITKKPGFRQLNFPCCACVLCREILESSSPKHIAMSSSRHATSVWPGWKSTWFTCDKQREKTKDLWSRIAIIIFTNMF